MRSRSSSSSSKLGGNKGGGGGGSMDNQIEKLKKLKEEPHLSGAYIRSLVKQLTSSRTKDPINPKLQETNSDGSDDHHLPQDLNKFSDQTQETHHSQQPQQPKKQVRRRLHTSRPYQERLLNMAEARREIVTALKFHRAAMKQANEQQQQPLDQSLQNPSSPTLETELERTKCRRNPRIYPSNITTNKNNCSNYLDNLSYSSPFTCPSPSFPPNPFFYGSTCSPIAPTLPIIDNLNLTLPNQPLGLNLNFHDFNNLDTTTLYYNNNNHNQNQFSIYSYSSPSSSSLSPSTVASVEEAHSFATSSPEEPPLMTNMRDVSGMMMNDGLHQMMDADEMAEIRSIAEQHEMEWNDTLNLVTSARWFKFLKKMEISPNEMRKKEGGSDQDDHGFNNNLFDEVMEFPAWMNANNESSSFLQQHLDDCYSEDYLQEPALPCMDIGEIDGMDGEWLA